MAEKIRLLEISKRSLLI